MLCKFSSIQAAYGFCMCFIAEPYEFGICICIRIPEAVCCLGHYDLDG